LIAAQTDQSTGIQWYNGSYITTGARGTVVGTGLANTRKIIKAQGAGSYAAKLCDELVIGANISTFVSDAMCPATNLENSTHFEKSLSI